MVETAKPKISAHFFLVEQSNYAVSNDKVHVKYLPEQKQSEGSKVVPSVVFLKKSSMSVRQTKLFRQVKKLQQQARMFKNKQRQRKRHVKILPSIVDRHFI